LGLFFNYLTMGQILSTIMISGGFYLIIKSLNNK
jgi:prolipoprotein diacylglyceryltransferase